MLSNTWEHDGYAKAGKQHQPRWNGLTIKKYRTFGFIEWQMELADCEWMNKWASKEASGTSNIYTRAWHTRERARARVARSMIHNPNVLYKHVFTTWQLLHTYTQTCFCGHSADLGVEFNRTQELPNGIVFSDIFAVDRGRPESIQLLHNKWALDQKALQHVSRTDTASPIHTNTIYLSLSSCVCVCVFLVLCVSFSPGCAFVSCHSCCAPQRNHHNNKI